MPIITGSARVLWSLSLPLAGGAAACEVYDPPPEAAWVLPTEGFWGPDDPLIVEFTEPIARDSLVFDVVPDRRDREGDLPADVTPLAGACRGVDATCGPLGVAIDAHKRPDGTITDRLVLTQNGAFEEHESEPMLLIVRPGLEDPAGRTYKVPITLPFSVGFCGATDAPVTTMLPRGPISFSSMVLPGLWLHAYLELAYDPATGRAIGIITHAEWPRADVTDPNEFKAEIGPSGWTRAFAGRVTQRPNASLALCSDPRALDLVVSSLDVHLNDFLLVGRLVHDTEHDVVVGSGTMSSSSVFNGDTALGAITTAWSGSTIRESNWTPGLPRVCADDPCSGLAAEDGSCLLLEPWPAADLCDPE